MNRTLVLLFILMAFCLSVTGQTKTKKSFPAFPSNLTQNKELDSLQILNNSTVKTRLKKLLGKKSYADFLESFETLNPVVKRGNYLFSSGCLIHACGHIESAIALDLKNQTVHAAIFREKEKTRFFNEKKRITPKVIRNWANRLNK